jgi:hypothetical protein
MENLEQILENWKKDAEIRQDGTGRDSFVFQFFTTNISRFSPNIKLLPKRHTLIISV